MPHFGPGLVSLLLHLTPPDGRTTRSQSKAPLQIPKTGKGKKHSQPVNKDRFVSKMFLRGDSVVMVLRNPK